MIRTRIRRNRSTPFRATRALRNGGAAVVIAGALALGAADHTGAQTTDDWAMFRHDPLHTGVSADTTVGAAHATNLKIQWHAKSGGGSKGLAAIQASPAAAYNSALGKTVVYVASTGTPSQLNAFDAATGAAVWSSPFSLDKGSVSSPAVYGNTVYLGDQDHTLYAVDATFGTLQCSYTTTGRIQTAPVVGDIEGKGPVVFIGDVGINERNNGGNEWAINGVGNTDGACSQKWKFRGWVDQGNQNDKTGSWSPPALGQDSTGRWLLVLGSSNPDDKVYALDAVAGTEVWHFQTAINGTDQDVGAPPTISAPGINGIVDGAVYINGKDHIEYALDLLTGAELWEFDMGADAGIDTNSVSGTSLVGGDVVVSYAKYTYMLDAVAGNKVWRTDPMASISLASPAVSGAAADQVVFEGDLSGVLYAYQLSDGSLLWSHQFNPTSSNAAIVASPAVSAGMVYIATAGPGKVFGIK
jgi:outer membrane protein assembly factor BamB